jgi:hypothetical protein
MGFHYETAILPTDLVARAADLLQHVARLALSHSPSSAVLVQGLSEPIAFGFGADTKKRNLVPVRYI